MKYTINERIRDLISSLNLSVRSFAASIGVPQTTLSNLLNRGSSPSISLITSILNRYEVVNPDWLINGNGPMFMESEIVSRLKQLISYYGDDKRDFAKKAKVTRGLLDDILFGKRDVRDGLFLQNVLTAYPEINDAWLLRGEGYMLREDSSSSSNIFMGNSNKNVQVGGHSGITITTGGYGKNIVASTNGDAINNLGVESSRSNSSMTSKLQARIKELENELEKRDLIIEGKNKEIEAKDMLISVLTKKQE